MSLFTYLFGKGYKGGPDFNLERTHYYDLNGIELEMTVPDSNIVFAPSSAPPLYPFKLSGWFEANCEQSANHFYVDCDAGGMWAYVGPYWKVGREPFGVLSLSVRIKRTLPDYTLAHSDLNALEAAIRWDYEEHFEAEEPGKYGRGQNRQTRKEARERFSQSHWQNDEGRRREALHIKKWSRELPEHFETREYGTQRWLYYALEREPNYPKHHYCQPLDEQYYLDVFFSYRLDFPQYLHLWKDHAEAAEQRMIERIRLNFPGRVHEHS